MSTQILLVEPEESDSNAEFLLRALGYTVNRVTSLAATQEMVANNPIDLVITSIEMPEGAAKLVERLKSISETPVLVLSPFNEKFEFDIARCISAGADDVLSAELMETLIASQVQSILEKQSLRQSQKEQLNEIEKQKAISDQKNRELQAMNELKNRFIGMAAHDLRNPLASICGFSEILIEGEGLGPDDKSEYLRIINSSSTHMLKLVNDILDVAVIESGKLELSLVPTSLSEIIRERVIVFEPLALKKKSKLITNFMQDDICDLDKGRIIQAIDNLISNAIKFSPAGSVITIDEHVGAQHVSVTVRDEGPGLSKEDLKLMFQDFKKLSAKPTGDEGSTGLGLAIVKRIVEAHKGEIRVESVLGEGASFIFKLPTS